MIICCVADSFAIEEEEMLLDLEGGLGPFGAIDSTIKIVKKEGTKLARRTSKGEFMIQKLVSEQKIAARKVKPKVAPSSSTAPRVQSPRSPKEPSQPPQERGVHRGELVPVVADKKRSVTAIGVPSSSQPVKKMK